MISKGANVDALSRGSQSALGEAAQGGSSRS
jgi:hypothetical protein